MENHNCNIYNSYKNCPFLASAEDHKGNLHINAKSRVVGLEWLAPGPGKLSNSWRLRVCKKCIYNDICHYRKKEKAFSIKEEIVFPSKNFDNIPFKDIFSKNFH